jgi:hypothetical protein
MLRQTLFALPFALALSLTVPTSRAGGAAPAIQEPAAPRLELRTEGDRVKALMTAAYGGVDVLDGLTGFKFNLVPSEFERQPDGTFVEKTGAPFTVEVDYRTGERNVRMEEIQDDKPVVRLISRHGNLVYIAGKPVELPELLAVAQDQARSILQYLDIYLGPPAARLPALWDQVRTRDKQQYYCFESQTILGDPLRLYVSQASHLIARVDLFNSKDGKRIRTFQFEDPAPVSDLPMPRLMRILDRDNKPIGNWRFENLEVNPKFPEKRFEAL